MNKSFKKLLICGLVTTLSLSGSLTTHAGTWKQDSKGWWYQRDNGSYPSNGWEWIDGNDDGIAECYYFDSVGYMLSNTTTPDGYQVNENGVWIIDRVVQTQKQDVQAVDNNANNDGHQMYFNYPQWTKEEVLSIKSLDDFNRRFYFGEYAPKEMLVITNQATSDKHAEYLDASHDYVTYLSSAYAYGLEKDIYIRTWLPNFTNHNLGFAAKSTEIYEASKSKFKWKSFDDFFIYEMMTNAQGDYGKGSIYTWTDSSWKKFLEYTVDNYARWEGQEVPNIYLTHDLYQDPQLLQAENLYRTYDDIMDGWKKDGGIYSTLYYDTMKKNEAKGFKWVEQTQFYKTRGGSNVPGNDTVNGWMEAMKPSIREKYGVEISWDYPGGTLNYGMRIWFTPVK